MSKTIDERVVSMQFDNSKFERNVSTTMSTLDKLKAKLNFRGASKGLEDINTAAKKIDLNPIGRAADTVGLKFSAMYTMADQVFRNITNSAMMYGKKIVDSLTIDPIKTGLSEYETKMNAVQVIQSNTRGKNDMNDITAALDELNEYADKTIYNFAQMTSNVGKFTAQGYDVKAASKAVQGLANLAAASGASAEDMARATYQMSQAMGGTIRMMDWNSLRNANMATVDLKNTLMDLAKVNGIAIDDMIKKHGTFEQTLQEGWLSGDMFTEAMNIYSGVYSEAELAAKGFTKSQIANFMDLAKRAEEAATEVKTFTQLWDVLKETAQSGWTQTWEIIFGDFKTAKEMFTDLQNYFSNIINKMSDARNTLLGGAFNIANPWNSIIKKLTDSDIGGIAKISTAVGDASNQLKYFQDVVNQVWLGLYNNAPVRYDMLEAAGYDHRVIQDLVNKGDEYELTLEDIEESHKKFGLTLDQTKQDSKTFLYALENLTDEELRNAKLTEAEIKLFRDLQEESKLTGQSIADIVDSMSKMNGRAMIVESFKNAWTGLVNIFSAVKKAWQQVFPPMTVFQLYKIISAINTFSFKLRDNEEVAKKIARALKGVFVIIRLITTILGGAFNIAFKVVSKVLEYFGLTVLDAAAYIGDAIVAVDKWVTELFYLDDILGIIIPVVLRAADGVKSFFNAVKNTEAYQKLAKALKGIGDSIKSWVDGLKESDNIGLYILQGLAKGLMSGAKLVFDTIIAIGTGLIKKICSIFGIESPSKVMIAIGGFLILGLITGIKEYMPELWATISGFGQKMLGMFSGIDFGSILAIGATGGLIVVLYKLATAITNITSPLEGLGDMFEGLGDMFEGFGKAAKGVALNLKAKALKNLAISIGILVAAIVGLAYYMSKHSATDLLHAVGIVVVLAGVLVGLAWAMDKMSKASVQIEKNKFSMSGMMNGILSIGLALLAIAGAVRLVGSMNPDQYSKGFIGLAGLVLSMVTVVLALGFLTKNGSDDAVKSGAKVIAKIGTALLLLAIVAKIMGNMGPDELAKAGECMVYLGILIAGLIWSTKLAGKDIDKVGSTIIKLSIALMLLGVVTKMLSKMTTEEFIAGGVKLATLMSALILSLFMLQSVEGVIDSVGNTLIKISGAIAILAATAILLSVIKPENMLNGYIAIAMLSLIVVGLLFVLKLMGPGEMAKVGTTILMVAAAIAALGLTATLLSMVPPDKLRNGVAVVMMLGVLMAALIAVTWLAKDCMKNLIVMTVAIAVMAGAVAALSFVDPEKLKGATIAMGALMFIFGLMIAATSLAKNCLGNLIVMTVVIAVMAGALYLLAGLPVESVLGSAIALSVLMGVMTIVLTVLGLVIGPLGVTALIGVGLLLAMAAPLYAFVGVLALMKNIENAKASVTALVVLTTAMTVLLIPLALVGALGAVAIIGVGLLLAMVVPLLAFVGVLALMQNVENAEKNVDVLTKLMLSMTVMLAVLAIISPLLLVAVAAVSGLVKIITIVGVLATAVGYLMEKFPALKDFLDNGMGVLADIASGIGTIIGNLVSAFMESVASSLPMVGTCLSEFMINATPFIDGVKMVDNKVLAGVGIITAAILALTAADLLAGITSFLTGNESFAYLGTELSRFIINATPFIEGASKLQPNLFAGVQTIVSIIRELTKNSILEGIASWITGGSSIETFGSQLAGLGTHINQFATNVGTFDERKVATVTCAANAVKAIAEVAKSLPNDGGWAGKILGDNSIAAFGSYLPNLGRDLSNFANNLGTFDEVKVTTISCAAKAVKAMAEAADLIPNDGGWVGKLVGENSIATFGSKLPSLGANLNAFATNLGTFDESKVTTVTCAANAVKIMAEAAESMDGQADWAKKLFGDNSLGSFGQQLSGLGKNLNLFVTNLGTFDESKITTVNTAVDAIKVLSQLADSDIKSAKKNLEGFGDKVVTFGKDIGTFVDKLPKPASVSTAIQTVRDILTLMKDIAGTDSKATSGFAKAMKDLGSNNIDTFVKSFTGIAAKANIKDAGKEMMNSVIDGAEEKKDDLKKSFSRLLSSVSDTIRGKYTNMFDDGSYLVTGLIAGINSKKQDAVTAAENLASSVEKKVRSALNINSPSKVFKSIGSSIPEGFALGIRMFGNVVRNASTGMTDEAVNTVKDSILRLSDIVESDIDTQPTIRPVLDLSAVRSGAGELGSILGGSRGLGVVANVGGISTMMNQNRQNGGNDDVVSAINKLRADLSNVSGDTYTFGDMTYDDGSNIANALSEVARAAKIERRR